MDYYFALGLKEVFPTIAMDFDSAPDLRQTWARPGAQQAISQLPTGLSRRVKMFRIYPHALSSFCNAKQRIIIIIYSKNYNEA